MENSFRKYLIAFILLTISVFIVASCSSADAKPSKKELIDHSVDVYGPQSRGIVDEAGLKKVYTCLFDSVYDSASKETLDAYLKADTVEESEKVLSGVKGKEKDAFDKAEEDCQDVFDEVIKSAGE